jgi:hypothetical protein
MPDLSFQNTYGGQYTTQCTAATPAVVTATPGRLCRIVVNVAGTAATVFYDNASAASGKIVYTLKASPSVGDTYDVQMPVDNGIYFSGAANTSGVTVSYTKDSGTSHGR